MINPFDPFDTPPSPFRMGDFDEPDDDRGDPSEPVEKDVFSILALAIDGLRHDVQRLQRTSLNQDEALELNETILASMKKMQSASAKIQSGIEAKLAASVQNIRSDAIEAAKVAVMESHSKSIEAAASLSHAAGEARKEAWRRFGGFWVWLASVSAAGAVTGAFAMFLVQGHADAKAFGQNPHIFCSSAGGQSMRDGNGEIFCAFKISPPE